jgi:hypothetical protein
MKIIVDLADTVLVNGVKYVRIESPDVPALINGHGQGKGKRILGSRRWQPGEDQRLLSLHDKGMPDGAIAINMTRTPKAVGIRLSRLLRERNGTVPK